MEQNYSEMTLICTVQVFLFGIKSEEAKGDPSAQTRQQHTTLTANRCLRESWHSATIPHLTETYPGKHKRRGAIVSR